MTNYMQVIKDSQSYTDLDMIVRSLEHLSHLLSDEKPTTIDKNGSVCINIESDRERVNYIITGIKNTQKNGYKLIKNDE